MAWIDNRAWCHPKIVALSLPAKWVWVSSICYSAGFLTEGKLTAQQLALIGSTIRIRRELEDAGLWIDDGPGIEIHEWEEHNGARDRKQQERRRRDAERKREQRSNPQASAPCPADSPLDSPADVQTVTGDRVTGDGYQEHLGRVIAMDSVLRGVV